MATPSSTRGLPLTQTRALLLWAFLGSYALDFRGLEAGGSAFQYGLCLVNMIACFLIMAKDPTVLRFRGRPLDYLAAYWFAFLAATFTIFVSYRAFDVSNLTLLKYLMLIVPYIGCGLSILAIRSLQAVGVHPRELTKPLLTTAVISMAWRFVYATQVIGISMSEMRFQLLSLAAPYLLAMGSIAIFLSRKVDLLRILIFVMTVAMVILSITRTYLIIVAICMFGALYLLYRGRKSPYQSLTTRAYTFASLILLLVMGLTVQGILRPDAFDTWYERMTNNAGGRTERDTTWLAREAEASGMWNAIKEDPLFLLFGKGVGATYSWDPSYLDELEKVGNQDQEALEVWQVSHSLWTYPIFSSGFVFGPMVYGIVLIPLFRGWKVAETQGMFADPRDQEVVSYPFITLAAYTGLSFFSNPLLDRYGGVLIGVFAATALWTEDMADAAKARSKAGGHEPAAEMRGRGGPSRNERPAR
jgi:hypothetical protein